MRPATRISDPALQAILDPRRLLRWVYTGRLSLATAIFIAAVLVWTAADTDVTLVASLAFALTAIVTVVSAGYSEIYRRPLRPTFLYLQAIFDLLLVTAVVHVTRGGASQFSALYILVIATSSMLVPIGGGLLIAALGSVLYFADVVWFLHSTLDAGLFLQLAVFAVVALASAYLSRQLRERGEGKARLVEELEQTRLRAEDILRNIRSGVVTVDVDGRLLYANPMAEHLLGLALLDRFGQPVFEVIGAVAPDLSHAIQRAVQIRARTTRGEAIVLAAGRRFPIGVTTTYTEHDDTGRGRTATAIFQDISDQKRLEVLRLRAERLEGVAELSASLAHEIKNPLASIRSAVEQISRMPQVSDDQRTLGALVLRESDRLSRLLSEFLDFARVRVARTEPVDLATVLQGAASLATAHPDRPSGVKITCVAPEGEALRVDGDEDLLHRAIFNLTLNAVQASPPEGEVRLEITRGGFDPLPAGVSFEAGSVALRVSDHGPGIAPEIRDRLFDPFFTTKPNGSGLGLAVVHRAIEAHRGLIFVDTGTRGTRFTVILPTSQAVARSAIT